MNCFIGIAADRPPAWAGAALAVAVVLVVLPHAALAQRPPGSVDSARMNRPQPADEEPRLPTDAQGRKDTREPESIADPDRDFAIRMRKHEEDSLTLAKAQLKHGADAEMRAIARSMIETRTSEISKLDAWIARRKPPANKPIPRML